MDKKITSSIICILVLALGLYLNHTVIMLNGGMPARGVPEPLFLNRYVPIEQSRMSFLGDIIYTSSFGDFSIGDIFVIVGAVWFVVEVGKWVWIYERQKKNAQNSQIRT